MEIWSELTHSKTKSDCLNKMIEHTGEGTENIGEKTLYVPSQFWFCKNAGCALPLIALQYHEVKINITFNSLSKLHQYSTTAKTNKIKEASLYVDYIYLDTDERRRFAQVSHEYLIEQLQFTGEETGSTRHTLNFNHPVKELVWITRNDDNISRNLNFNYDAGVFAIKENIIIYRGSQ